MGSLLTAIKWKVQEFPIRRSGKQRLEDYGRCTFSVYQELRCTMEGLGIMAVIAYFFYRSIYAFLLLTPMLYFYRKKKKSRSIKKRSEQLEKEFREVLLSVNINLQAGYSIENSFLECYTDIVNLYGSSADMVRELLVIRRGMNNQIPLEQLLLDLGNRCPGGEVQEFAEVFSVSKKTGGRWQEMMKRTVDMIQEKAEIKEEIQTLIHARKMESRIMCLIPFILLFYMDLTSPGYFDPLYHNPAGILIMTVCLLLYCMAVGWIEKITDIAI